MSEAWVDIPGHPGYQVSDQGRVRSVDRVVQGREGSARRVKGRVLTPLVRPDGLRVVNLWLNNTYCQRPVRELVLVAFDRPCPTGFEAVNVNGDSVDNRLCNLRWRPSARGR